LDDKKASHFVVIQPSNPAKNAYLERFKRTARQEWLELNIFNGIEYVQILAMRR
jgi:putative transposase